MVLHTRCQLSPTIQLLVTIILSKQSCLTLRAANHCGVQSCLGALNEMHLFTILLLLLTMYFTCCYCAF